MTEGACPSCGAPVTFTVGSARIVVCGYCRTVVAREGESLLARGRMAALAETQTPFRLGLEGRWSQTAFTIVGHLQKDYGAGVWDEWYLVFADGREGWLSESEGALHLMFSRGEEPALSLDLFRPGHDAYVGGKRVVVEEVRRARTASAAGQLPSDVKGDASTVAVDATGPGGVFVTYDFGERQRAPEIFVGRRVRLDELGIPASELVPRKPKRARLQAARCPKCQGPLELKAPDSAMRVACPFCGSLLDVTEGKLAFLQALQPPDHPPKLALGSSGKLGGQEWMVIGFMVRSCTVDGVRYPWDEYLLWSREDGFTFLMDSNGHWTHLVPLPAGEVRVSPGTAAYYGHTRYRAFQQVQAVTETVQGEFYWQVRAGEYAEAIEYVAPPHSINVDATLDEVTYTHGTWLPPEEIEKAFGLQERLPTPHGVAPAQPYPKEARVTSNLRWLLVYAALGVLLYAVMKVTAAEQVVLKETFVFDPSVPPGTPAAMIFSDPFRHLPGRQRPGAGRHPALERLAGACRATWCARRTTRW